MTLPAHIVSNPFTVYKAKTDFSRSFSAPKTSIRRIMVTIGDLIDVPALRQWYKMPECRVIDCRFDLLDADKGYRDYLAGHIPGASHADMNTDLAGAVTPSSGRHPLPTIDAFRRCLEGWGIGNETHVIAYDYGNGALASRLWWMLKYWLGHDRVSVLDGGIAAWVGEGEALETEVPRYARAVFSAQPDYSPVATTAEVEAALLAGGHPGVLDARDAARYKGEVEPIDRVAGHIPGARNLPLSRNLTAEGRWRRPDELAATWQQALAQFGGHVPIVMCGSGVTACHLILAATVAGQPVPRLYVGSWSEWIRDPKRPIATGERA